jgi:hypothetical protein
MSPLRDGVLEDVSDLLARLPERRVLLTAFDSLKADPYQRPDPRTGYGYLKQQKL